MTPTAHACGADRGAIHAIEIHVRMMIKADSASVLTARPAASPTRGTRTASRAIPFMEAITSSTHHMSTARTSIDWAPPYLAYAERGQLQLIVADLNGCRCECRPTG